MRAAALNVRLGAAAVSFIRKPAAALGAWTQVAAGFAGAAARYVGPIPGDSEVVVTPPFGGVPNGQTHTLLCAQLLSDPLAAQKIAAGSWRVAFCARLANATAFFRWRGQAALFVVNGLTGERRGTIFNLSNVGSGSRNSTLQLTCLGQVTGLAVEVFTGDYLVLELGLAVSNAAAVSVPVASVFGDGQSTITADAVNLTNQRGVLLGPQDLVFSLPQAGEFAPSTVGHAAALTLIKEAFPPDSDLLYDWDAPDATVKQLLDVVADVIKLYGYDQADRLLREISPLTCVELLPYWERALGIARTAANATLTPEERRPAVLGGIRARGPLTPYNLLTALAPLAGYAPGTSPELLEMRASDIAPIFSENVGAAIPERADFDNVALRRQTPVLLDGGFTWATGASVQLELSAARSSGCRFRLVAPDYVSADWQGGPDRTQVILRSPAFAGGAVHGAWQLYARRAPGAPAVDLVSWSLTTYGVGFGGRGQAKGEWSVYFDAQHQGYDVRLVRQLLDKVTQSYCRSFAINAKTSIPGTSVHRPGQFVPGA